MNADSNIIATLASNPTALAAYLDACAAMDDDSGVQVVADDDAKPAKGRKAKPAASPRTNGKAKPAATAPDEIWTCRKVWKGVEPTGGILWAARQAGVSGDLLASADKYVLSQAIGKARGLKVQIVP